MKHVFFIHSQITSLVSREIMLSKKLERKDCAIITLDIYEKNINQSYFGNIPVYSFPYTQFNSQKLNTLKKEFSLYFWINKKLNYEQYIYYTIHDKVFLSKYISNNFRCKEYYYIEEGISSFYEQNASHYLYNRNDIFEYLYYIIPVRLPGFIAKKRVNIKRILPRATFLTPTTLYSRFDKLKGAYKISEKAFHFIEKSILLSLVDFDKKLDALDAPFFVFDNLVDSKICTLETLIKVFKTFLAEENIKVLNIKFHPLQPLDEVAVWKDILKKNNIEYFVINNSVVLEEYVGSNSYLFYGFVSSLLYYNVNLSKAKGQSTTYLKRVYDIENQSVPSYYQQVLDLFQETGIQIK